MGCLGFFLYKDLNTKIWREKHFTELLKCILEACILVQSLTPQFIRTVINMFNSNVLCGFPLLCHSPNSSWIVQEYLE